MTTSNIISGISLIFSIIAVTLTVYTLYQKRVNLKLNYDQYQTFIYPLFSSNTISALIVFVSIYNPQDTGVTISKITLSDKENTYLSASTNEDLIIHSKKSMDHITVPIKSQFLSTPCRLVNHDGIEGYCIFKNILVPDENIEKTYILTVHTSNKNFSIPIKACLLNKDKHSKILPQNFML